jgi:hypothetical protein
MKTCTCPVEPDRLDQAKIARILGSDATCLRCGLRFALPPKPDPAPALTPHAVDRPVLMADPLHPPPILGDYDDEVEVVDDGRAEYAAALSAHEAATRSNEAHRRQEWLDATAQRLAGTASDWPRGKEATWARRCYDVAAALWSERQRRIAGGA